VCSTKYWIDVVTKTPDRITKRNIDGETTEEPRIVRGVLYKIRMGDVNIHVRGENPLFLQRTDDNTTD
jgi:hypothetical protein